MFVAKVALIVGTVVKTVTDLKRNLEEDREGGKRRRVEEVEDTHSEPPG